MPFRIPCPTPPVASVAPNPCPALTHALHWQVVIPPISPDEVKLMQAKLIFGVRGVKGLNEKKRRKHELNYAM